VGTSPVVSAGNVFKATTPPVSPATINIGITDKGYQSTPTISGTITEYGFACQTSNGGLSQAGSLAFRGNFDYGNSYYSYNSGLAHVIFVNQWVPYEAGSLQYNWLAADLKAVNRAQTPWIIVNIHAPLYSTNIANHASNPNDPVNAPWSSVPKQMQEYGMLAAWETVFFKAVRAPCTLDPAMRRCLLTLIFSSPPCPISRTTLSILYVVQRQLCVLWPRPLPRALHGHVQRRALDHGHRLHHRWHGRHRP
jgi:hypothetical protein